MPLIGLESCSSPKGGTPLALETADFYNYLYSSNGITKNLAGWAGVRTPETFMVELQNGERPERQENSFFQVFAL